MPCFGRGVEDVFILRPLVIFLFKMDVLAAELQKGGSFSDQWPILHAFRLLVV
jgi:hypothetical protein